MTLAMDKIGKPVLAKAMRRIKIGRSNLFILLEQNYKSLD